jgi:dTMP kinase
MADKAETSGTTLSELADSMRGHVTCIEGVDGAGKTTALQWLRDELGKHVPDTEIVMVREPGGTPVGESIRDLLLHRKSTPMHAMTETLLFFAARAELYDAVILPSLAAGHIVLADRCLYSTIAYQCYGLADQRAYAFDLASVLEIAELVLPRISEVEDMSIPPEPPSNRGVPIATCRPSCTVVLDVSQEVRHARFPEKQVRDNIESRNDAFFERVCEGYREISRLLPHVYLVNGGATVEDVQRDIVEVLARRYSIPF